MVVAAAVFGYLGGWVVKRQEVERSIAAEVDELLEQAQLRAAEREAWSEEWLRQILQLVQTAKLRCRRLADEELADRFSVCELFALDALLAFRDGQRYWIGEAISNIRLGLDPYTSPPRLLPRLRPPRWRQRIFPSKDEYQQLIEYEGEQQVPRLENLAAWQRERGVR